MLVPIKRVYFPIFILLLFFGNTAHGQIKGTIVEKNNNHPIPFAKITYSANNTNRTIIGEINGDFIINDTAEVKSITVEAYRFKTSTITLDTLVNRKSALTIPLIQNLVFEISNSSTKESLELINKAISNRKKNNFQNLNHFSYTTYNKTTLRAKHVGSTNRLLKRITKFFSLKFTDFKDDQHFLILESYTERKVFNKYHHKEIIKGAKSTVLDVPSIFIQTTQLHAFTPYNDYISLSGMPYVSPISKFIFHKYLYNIIDTIAIDSDTIYVVKYHPYPNQDFDGLNGLLYINTKNYAVQYFTATPFLAQKTIVETYQSFKYYPKESVWFPDRTLTKIIAYESDQTYTATLDTYISDVELNDFVRKKDFDEIVLHYPSYAPLKDEDFWTLHRKTPLTLSDSNTYNYYNSVDQKKYIQRTLTFGENLYYGVYRKDQIDINLDRVFDGNQLEGVRIGLGIHTNSKFSERFKLGGYFGYGFRDQENKGGVDVSYSLKKLPIIIQSSIFHDIQEAGGVFFPFNTYQYSSEPLRRVGIRMFDYISKWEHAALLHPLKFLDIKTSFNYSHHVTSYAYIYRNAYNGIFNFAELELGARYAYGEQFIKLLDRKFSTATPFPIFYFHYTKGMNNFLGGNFSYSRYEAKIDYKVKIPNIGITGIELIGGLVTGNPPYAKLFNGNGSYRKFSVVIHNSFEAMRYNEFLSDKYIALFMSHNFGRIYFKLKFLTPSLLIVQNMGFGGLSHPEYHTHIEFKTMRKGYYESGMLLDNLFLIGLKGLKIGIGPGFFYRYGPYAEDTFAENFVVKLSTKFMI